MNSKLSLGWAGVLASLLWIQPASASFHVMRVEQLFGTLNGDTSAQAIQLQMRTNSQNLVSQASIWATDATGSNRILLLDITTNVSNSAAGARIVLCTSSFTTAMATLNPGFTPDFTLTNAIPASYLAAGRLTFEQDGGTVSTPGVIYWSVSWGGSAYTGSNIGSSLNDNDGNFGPPYPNALPNNGNVGIKLTSTFSASSTTNAADYSLTTDPVTLVKNNGTSASVPSSLQVWRKSFFNVTTDTGNAANTFDFDKDGLPNLVEFALGLNPTQNSAHLFPMPQRLGNTLVSTFAKPSTVFGITYRAESNNSLIGTWSPIADTGSGSQHVFSIPISGAKDFMRFKVTEP